jgi:hypothetical protein
MSILNSILGRPDASQYPAANASLTGGVPASNGYGLPALNGQMVDPTTDLGSDTYQPINYSVPTGVPAWAPAGVTTWRTMETMKPTISAKTVTEYKNVVREVPIEAAARTSRAAKAAESAATVETAEVAGRTAAETSARTASRTKAASTAAETEAVAQTSGKVAAEAEAVATTKTVTERVPVQKTKVNATPNLTTAGLLSAVKSSAIVAGGLSLLFNGYAVMKGQQSFAEGGSNDVGDVAAGAIGGAGGAVASAVGTSFLAGALGIASGGWITLLSLGLGIGGYMLTDKLFRSSGFFKSLKQDVFNLLSGKPKDVYTGPVGTPGYAGPLETPVYTGLPSNNAFSGAPANNLPSAVPSLP